MPVLVTWLLSAMNMSPRVGSSARSLGLDRLEASATACQRPSSSNTSTFWPRASATYSLSPTQSTARATGAHDPAREMSAPYVVMPAGAFSGCEWIWNQQKQWYLMLYLPVVELSFATTA